MSNFIVAELRSAFPEVVASKRFLGQGDWGVVIGDDTTVTKFLFRHHSSGRSFDAIRQQYEREVSMLRSLRDINVDGAVVPKLLEGPVHVDHHNFAAYFSMARIKGFTHDIKPKSLGDIPEYKERYHRIGALLAKFHSAVEGLDLKTALPIRPSWQMSAIHPLPNVFSDRINDDLEAANSYFRSHLVQGNMHGDWHPGNIVEMNGKPVGILDFSFAGSSQNAMQDFWWVPDALLSSMIAGYESVDGHCVKYQALAARVSRYSHILSPDFANTIHESEAEARTQIPMLLEEMRPVL